MGSSAIRSSPRVDAPLRQAAGRLLENLPAELRQLAPDFLGVQLEWVLASSDGRQTDEEQVAPATLVVRRLLIDALGSQLLGRWNGAADDAPGVLHSLQ